MKDMDQIKRVAMENGLVLYEHLGVDAVLLAFPDIDKGTPLLASADEGGSWCPECDGPQGKMWSGRISLRGADLEAEITDMYRELILGSPLLMLKVARELQALKDVDTFS